MKMQLLLTLVLVLSVNSLLMSQEVPNALNYVSGDKNTFRSDGKHETNPAQLDIQKQ